MKHLLAISLGMISLVWVTGCNKTSSPPPPPTLTSIAVTPATPSVALSTPQQFKATGTFSDNSTQDLTATATWSSSATTIATISSAGLAATVGVGPTTIKATSGSVSGSTPFTVTPGFIATGSLAHARDGFTATLLLDGKVLIAGGFIVTGAQPNQMFPSLASAEIYDPATGAFTATGSMNTARNGHTATLLNNGMVLIAGGPPDVTLGSAELYNPSTGVFCPTGNMNAVRQDASATLLDNGKVLIAGGDGVGVGFVSELSSAELYNPATGIFTSTGSMSTARELHSATRLADGRVLVAGGRTGTRNNETEFASAEIYNLATGTFTSAGNMSTARVFHTAILLNNGLVLVAGGTAVLDSGGVATSELFNPTTGKFTATGSMSVPRAYHAAKLLNNGTVLLAGGCSCQTKPFSAIASAEFYIPAAGTFASTGGLNTARASGEGTLLGGTLLNSGTVLVAGAEDATASQVLTSAELYEPGLPTLVSIAITPANPSIAFGSSQSFIATGTFSDGTTSPLASAIWSSSNPGVASISNDATNKGTAVAVAAGSTAISAMVGSVTNSTTLTVH
jgi:hypothetical protein